MIIKRQNIFQNWHYANASGDMKMKRDVLLSEIAKIVVTRPNVAINDLRKHGFKINNNPSTSELVSAISAGLFKSRKYAKDMAIAILSGYYGADGGTGAGTGTGIVNGPTEQSPAPTPTGTNTGTGTGGGGGSETTAPTGLTTGNTGTSGGTVPQNIPNTTLQPLIGGLGNVFGGVTSNAPPTIPSTQNPPSTNVTVNLPPSPNINTGNAGFGGYGGGGFGGGGGGEAINDEAKKDLLAKANALKGGGKNKVAKVIGISLLIAAIAGGTWWFANNKN